MHQSRKTGGICDGSVPHIIFSVLLYLMMLICPPLYAQQLQPLFPMNLHLESETIKEWSRSTKLSTDLLQFMAAYDGMKAGQKMADVMPLAETFLVMDHGMIGLEIAALDVEGCLAKLTSMGLKHISHFRHMINCMAPLSSLESLKGMAEVKFVRLSRKPLARIGSITSQGDIAQMSDLTRIAFGVNGAGSKIGVLSDSYDNLGDALADIASGDLPGPGNPFGFDLPVDVIDDIPFGGLDEGRAMIQIIHDVAPGAEVAFHTAFNGYADFAQGILDLEAAGSNIIVDDILYFVEPYYSPGLVSQAVEQVCANGAMYFSSAGNSGRESYESIYDGSTGVEPQMDNLFGPSSYINAHAFAPGDSLLSISFNPGSYTVVLQWDEPFFSSTADLSATTLSDLDLGVYVGGSLALGSLVDNIFLTGDAVELVSFNVVGFGPLVVDFHIPFFGGFTIPNRIKLIVYGSPVVNWEYGGDAPTVVGHANTPGACAVGASAFFFTPKYGVDPPGLNNFSSWGGVPLVYDAFGNAISPIILNKPDLVAPDGGNNTFFGSDTDFDPDALPNFFGTSASAPHAAAAASLVFEANSNWDKNQVKSALEISAMDMLSPGFDLGSGHGLIQTPRAVSLALGETVAPNCRDLDASIDYIDGIARVAISELVVNGSSGVGNLEVLVQNSAGMTIFQSDNLIASDLIFITNACKYTDQTLKVRISNSLGTCWSRLTLNDRHLPILQNRATAVYCNDPLVEGGGIGGAPPTAQLACSEVGQATHVADWVTSFLCDPGNQDTLKIIAREWEAFDKWGQRGISFDTIVVLAFPEIDDRHFFCPDQDTIYCSDTTMQIGPFFTSNGLNSRICDTTYLIKITDQDEDGRIEFIPASFVGKCGVNVHVDYWKFNRDCDSQYKVIVELKQDCYGLAQSGCPVSPPAGTPPNAATPLGPGYWRCEFWVTDLDTVGPEFYCKEPAKMVSTTTHECAVHTYISPIYASDDWSGIKQAKATIEGVGSFVLTYNEEEKCYESHTRIKLAKKEGPYYVTYEVFDSCHNVTADTCFIFIKDRVKPVPVVDKGLTVSLSDKKVWVDAESFDEGSWDNCGINHLLVRRADWYDACIDLCDSFDYCWVSEHHDTIWQAFLQPDKHRDEVEAHYAKTLQWLWEDEEPCNELLYNAWQYDLMKHATLKCREHPYEVDGQHFRKLVEEAWYDGLYTRFKHKDYLLAASQDINGVGANARTLSGILSKVSLDNGKATVISTAIPGSTEIEYDVKGKKLLSESVNGLPFLYELDPETGAVLNNYQHDPGAYTGMEYIEGKLYATFIDESGGMSYLVVLDPVGGTHVVIGATGYGPIPGLAYDECAQVLYGVTNGVTYTPEFDDTGVPELVTISLETGKATAIGEVGYDAVGSIEFGPDGKLYGGLAQRSAQSGFLIEIDPETGAGTTIGNTGNPITGLTSLNDGCISKKLDMYEQIGGGWSDAVVFSCEDACGPVTVEILVMDYWCNWAKAWTNVWVEDKTPVQVVKDVIDEETITCKSYKDARYDYPGQTHPVSLDYVVEQAKAGEEDAYDLLDEVFGGYCKAWKDPYGNYVDIEGNEIECDIPFYDSVCQCTSYTDKVRVYDEHHGFIWKDSLITKCDYYQDTIDFQKGIVLVNCEENVYCEQEVWCEFDHCGQGYIFRKFKIWQSCPDSFYLDHNVPDSLKHPVDTIYRHQRIWVGNECPLSKYMFDVPEDTEVNTCGLEYDASGNLIGAAGPESTGYATYRFDDDCRLVGIGHSDKVFKIVGGDAACYKILRTWYFADWCGYGGEPLEAQWWFERELVIDSCVQKIIVIDTMPPVCVITGPVESGGSIEVGACAYNLEVTVSAIDSCGIDRYYWELLDISDSTATVVVDDGSGSLGGSGDESFDISSEDLDHGTYKLKVVTVDNCNNEGYCEYVVDVVSVKKPSPVCVTSLTARLTPWDSDQDGEVDSAHAVVWAGEFDRSSAPACQDTAIEFRIEFIKGDSTDNDAAGDADSLSLGCSDIGTHLVRLWVVSLPSDSRDYCDVVLIVQSDGDGCGTSEVGEREPLREVSGMTEESRAMDRGMLSTDGGKKATGIGGRPLDGRTLLPGQGYGLEQNRPNPFAEETSIGFVLPSSMEATITVYDVTGRIIRSIEGDFQKGYNQVQFRKTDLGVSGILYYRLNAGTYTAARKMILIE